MSTIVISLPKDIAFHTRVTYSQSQVNLSISFKSTLKHLILDHFFLSIYTKNILFHKLGKSSFEMCEVFNIYVDFASGSSE